MALGCFRAIAKTCPRDAIEQVVEIMTRVAVRELTDDNVPRKLDKTCLVSPEQILFLLRLYKLLL